MTTPQNRLATGNPNSGRFQPGVSGNPGGRPKGLAAYVREETGDGQYLVDKVLYILEHPKGKGIQAQRLQLECIQWLADRGFGKAVLGIVHASTAANALADGAARLKDMSDEDLQTLVDAGRALNEANALANAKVIEGEGKVLDAGN